MTTSDPSDPTTRFSDRVQDYVRWRPGYPPAVLEALRADLGLQPSHVVADVGSGTGILSRLLVENGNVVYGVEPNREMAAVASSAPAAASPWSGTCGAWTPRPSSAITRPSCVNGPPITRRSARSTPSKSRCAACSERQGGRSAVSTARSTSTSRASAAGSCPARTLRRKAIRVDRRCWPPCPRCSRRTPEMVAWPSNTTRACSWAGWADRPPRAFILGV